MKLAREFIKDPSLVLYLPLWKRDGASFMSDDKHGHLATVTGALWTPRGRSFDGTDDKIALPNNAFNWMTGAFTIEVWFNLTTLTGAHFLFSIFVDANNQFHLQQIDGITAVQFYLYEGGVNLLQKQTALLVTSVNTHLVFLWDGLGKTDANIRCWQNNEEKTNVAYSNYAGTPTGISGILGTHINEIGVQNAGGYFNGKIMELRLYNRVLTVQEIQHNYLATKWRYK